MLEVLGRIYIILSACVQMELRYQEVSRARGIYERYVQVIPTVKAWVRYAKFEMQNGEIGLARGCYERAVEELGEDAETVSCPVACQNTSDLAADSGIVCLSERPVAGHC